MNRLRRAVAAPAAAAVSLVLMTACATASPGAGSSDTVPFGQMYPAPPEGEVVAQGTVMDVGGDVELCLGAIAESYPPQCSGIPLEGWTWDGVDGSETSGDTTWGAYALQGTYDGKTFTSTQPPVMLALYDPMPVPDPTGGKPGAGEEDDLVALQDDLPDRLGDQYLSSGVDNGYLWIDVVWDDGTLQDAADAEFGENVVVVRSAMRALEE